VADGALSANVSLLGSSIASNEIANGTIVEADLSADNGAVDGDFLQYDSTGTNFVWRSGSETLSDIGAEGDLANEAGLYAALSDVSRFWEAGDTINSGTLTLDSLSFTGTLNHEYGGLELDISSIGTGDILAGASAGTLEIVDGGAASDGDVLMIQADGTVNFETPAPGGAFTSSGGYTYLNTIGDSVGIGSSSPSSKLTVQGDSGGLENLFSLATSTGYSLFSVSSSGDVDINDGAFFYDISENTTAIERLDLGNVEFEEDAGWVSWIDLDVTSSAASGDVMAYSAQIDASELLTVYGEADGSGGTQLRRVYVGDVDSGVLSSSNVPDGSFIVGDGIICVDNAGGANCDDASRTAGYLYAESSSVTAIDLAENYPTRDTSIEAGELVSLAPKFDEVCTEIDETGESRCKDSDTSSVPLVEWAEHNEEKVPTLLGVISTEPGILLGGFGAGEMTGYHKVPVALSGRVPVKVTNENGIITPGDHIVLSKTMPGYGMKADEPGTSVGLALEGFSPVSVADKVDVGTDDTIETTMEVLDNEGVEYETVKNKRAKKATSSDDTRSSIDRELETGEDDEIVENIVNVNTTDVATGTIMVFVDLTPIYFDELDTVLAESGFLDASEEDVPSKRSWVDFLAWIGVTLKEKMVAFVNVATESLTVGTAETPSGITLYDEVTGAPYCLVMRGGVMTSLAGTCAEVDVNTPAFNPSATVDTNASSTDNSGGDVHDVDNSTGDSVTGDTSTTSSTSSISVALLGDSTVTLSLNEQYTDMGIEVSGASDDAYQYTQTVDGAEVTEVVLDTSTTSQYEIVYQVVDSNGSVASTTREVLVQSSTGQSAEMNDLDSVSTTSDSSSPGETISTTTTDETEEVFVDESTDTVDGKSTSTPNDNSASTETPPVDDTTTSEKGTIDEEEIETDSIPDTSSTNEGSTANATDESTGT
jgi:hypothetical protein